MPVARKSLPYRLNPPNIEDFTDGFIRQGHAFVVALNRDNRTVCVKKWSRQGLTDSDRLEFNLSTFFATPKAWDRDLGVVRVEVTLDVAKYA